MILLGAFKIIRKIGSISQNTKSGDLDVNNNEQEGSSVNDVNDYDFFMNDKESVEQDKKVDSELDIPEWFSSEKKRRLLMKENQVRNSTMA